MKKTKTLLMLAVGFLVIGALLMGIGRGLGGSMANVWVDSSGLEILPAHVKYEGEKESYKPMHKLDKTPIDSFTELEIDLKYADIIVVPSDGFYLEYQLSGRREVPFWEVSDDSFTLRSNGYSNTGGNGGRNYLFAFSYTSYTYDEYEYVKLYVPQETLFGTWAVKNAHGDIHIEGVQTENCTLDLQYADMLLKNSHMADLTVSERHGDITLNKVELGKLIMDTQYSDIKLEDVVAEGIRLEDGQHGDLNGSNVKTVSFFADGDYLNYDIVGLTSSKVEMDSNHGDISLDLQDCSDIHITGTYSDIDLKTDKNMRDYQSDIIVSYGDIHINREDYEDRYRTAGEQEGILAIDSKHGDVDITSAE